MNSRTEEILNQLARVKAQLQQLEAEAKTLMVEAVIIGDLPKKFEAEPGVMTLATRQNWTVRDNDAVIKEIGIDLFKKYAKISYTGIQSAGGESAVAALHGNGAMIKGADSIYYQLKVSEEWQNLLSGSIGCPGAEKELASQKLEKSLITSLKKSCGEDLSLGRTASLTQMDSLCQSRRLGGKRNQFYSRR